MRHALTRFPPTFALPEELVVGGKGDHGRHAGGGAARSRRLARAGSCYEALQRLVVLLARGRGEFKSRDEISRALLPRPPRLLRNVWPGEWTRGPANDQDAHPSTN